jgi:hypothetical protein
MNRHRIYEHSYIIHQFRVVIRQLKFRWEVTRRQRPTDLADPLDHIIPRIPSCFDIFHKFVRELLTIQLRVPQLFTSHRRFRVIAYNAAAFGQQNVYPFHRIQVDYTRTHTRAISTRSNSSGDGVP